MGGLGAAACSACFALVSVTRHYRDLSYSNRGKNQLMKSTVLFFPCAVQALDDLKVLPFLNPVLISGQEGIEKPAPAIYLRACERAQVDPAETLHVGDELQA